jgi:hypothetical protein
MLLGLGFWQTHNALSFDNSSFTSVGAFNLLYYRAADWGRYWLVASSASASLDRFAVLAPAMRIFRRGHSARV